MVNKRHGGGNPESPDRLKAVFQQIAAGGEAQFHPAQLWHIMLTDPWLQAEVASRAKRFVACSGLAEHVSEDIAQQVLLLLAAKLAADPSLHAKAELLPDRFEGWMGTILDRACGKAARLLKEYHQAHPKPREVSGEAEDWSGFERRIDFAAAAARLEGRQCAVMLLFLQGLDREKIACKLGLHYKQVVYALKTATRKLQRWLQGYGDDDK
jgi:DNA-directed RNA polymerase specialized sigma24 family protein